MPIYAYRCQECGHAKDVLQKIADAPLTVCPSCGASAFVKQVTAAGFQLKGSGWYVTDFRGGGNAAKNQSSSSGTSGSSGSGEAQASASTSSTDSTTTSKAD